MVTKFFLVNMMLEPAPCCWAMAKEILLHTFVKSGFKVDGDAKALGKLKNAVGEEFFIATQNLDSIRVFKFKETLKSNRSFQPLAMDSYAELHHQDGKKEKVEFYYGSGYLSQSTRSIVVPATVTAIKIYDYSGNQRNLEYSQLALQQDN